MQAIKCISLSTMRKSPSPSASVICLGNFDGVHLAHRELMKKTASLQAEVAPRASRAVFCFDPPTSELLSPTPIPQLTTKEEKLALFREMGMEYAFLADFAAIRDLSPDDFVKLILQGECGCVAAVCGFNYRFGKNADGTGDDLKRLLGAPVFVQNEVLINGETVSSTAIRRYLSDGEVKRANQMLARPYAISAEIIHGKALGQKLGTPTLNQRFPSGILIPRHGVYVTDCEIDGRIYRGVSNVGLRPTVEKTEAANCETYLLDFSGDLYGRTLRVVFRSFIRPEQTFDSLDTLREQIARDIAYARSYTEQT